MDLLPEMPPAPRVVTMAQGDPGGKTRLLRVLAQTKYALAPEPRPGHASPTNLILPPRTCAISKVPCSRNTS